MVSLEPATVGGCGYPDLLATGELCDGDSIHDRQHPHDFLMEVAGEYDRPLRGNLRWQLYGGLAGEPALGPVAFPHRPSAMPNPIAPIGHHWLDATHITFGVVTTGVFTSRWKVEASLFNGREPDENRWDLDLGALDSFSGRVSFAPSADLVLQVSAGHLTDAEAGEGSLPRADVDRVTASLTYHRRVGAGTLWASTLAWGRNDERNLASHAFLGGDQRHGGRARRLVRPRRSWHQARTRSARARVHRRDDGGQTAGWIHAVSRRVRPGCGSASAASLLSGSYRRR